MKDLKIIELRSENVKKIKVVTIKPEGNTVVIAGGNGEGKSSVIDSIEYALSGAGSLPDMPIRKGEKKAKINIDLGEIKIQRTFKDGKSALKITSKDGAAYPSPQAMLDEIAGNLSFDPMNFISVPESEQRKILLELIGVNTDKLDEKRKGLYDDRTLIGRGIKELEGKLAGAEHNTDLPEEVKSATELTDKILHENQQEATKESYNERISQGKVIVEINAENIKGWEADIAKAKEELVRYNKTLVKLEADQKAITVGDIAALKVELEEIEEVNTLIRDNNKIFSLTDDLRIEQARKTDLDDAIKAIDTEKEKTIADAKMPIKDLSFSSDCVTYKEIPLKQVNSADQFKVCLAMGMALNPTLKVILFKNGSLLDKKSLKYVSDLAEKHDYQIWIERVDETGEVGIVIEDGEVK